MSSKTTFEITKILGHVCLHESFVQIDNNSFLKRANFLTFTEMMMHDMISGHRQRLPRTDALSENRHYGKIRKRSRITNVARTTNLII